MSQYTDDLMYADESVRQRLAAAFPTARVEDASDAIHEHRFKIMVDLEEREWLRALCRLGLQWTSLAFALYAALQPETAQAIEAEAKEEGKES